MGSTLENVPSFVHPMDFSKHSVNPTKSASQYCDYPRHLKMHPDNTRRQKAEQKSRQRSRVRDGLRWRKEDRKGDDAGIIYYQDGIARARAGHP